jgi:outer membrane protein TolC
MKPILPIALFALCQCALAQQPPVTPMPSSQTVPKPSRMLPGKPESGTPSGITGTVNLTLQNAMERARIYSQQVYTASYASQISHEDTRQAKAALLPQVNEFNQFIYTQPAHNASGVFVSNDGPHVYNNWINVHGDIYNPVKLADYRKAQFAEVVARAKLEIAERGLIATVVQNYYAVLAARRRIANAEQNQREAEQFVDITEKLERGGEAAHYDTVKARSQLLDRQRDTQDAQLSFEKARLALAVLLFPDFRQDFTVTDDLDTAKILPPFTEMQVLASNNNPDIGAAQAMVRQQSFETKAARAERLPSLSFDYWYGMNSNQFAILNQEGAVNLGSVAAAQVTIPVWTWGAIKSRIRQSELRQLQARADLSLTQRQLLSNLNSFYLEASTANAQISTLRTSLELAEEVLKLTLLRYEGGEGSVLEVVDAQTSLVTARNLYNDGLVRYRVALANLQTLTGAF